jgi:ubiquinone/menaquinone biosynthesis C-methylase UbiE
MPQEDLHHDTRQNYDRLSSWYDLFSTSERRLSEGSLRLLAIQPGEKVLEIGFGTGHALIELARAGAGGASIYGIDLSPGMYEVASRRVQNAGMTGQISLQLGDATRLPFSNHQFQAAFMGFTLELFSPKEIPVVLAECQRVLQPGGRIGIVSLAKQDSRTVEIYEWFHLRFPKVIDCHPIFVSKVIEVAGFEDIQTVEKKLWGLPVETVVARNP